MTGSLISSTTTTFVLEKRAERTLVPIYEPIISIELVLDTKCRNAKIFSALLFVNGKGKVVS